MQCSELESNLFPRLAKKASLFGGVLMAFLIAGCGGSTTKQTSTTTASPQTYFAPVVSGVTYTNGSNSVSLLTPQTYSIDDAGGTFSQSAFGLLNTPGSQVLTAGGLSVGQRGLRSLGIDVSYVCCNSSNGNAVYYPVTYPTPEPGSFAVELAGQTGGLVQLLGQPVAPLVAATQCPNFTTPQTYQFITLPEPSTQQGTNPRGKWNSNTDTAYGSVDIVSSGSTVKFQNINQSTLGGGTPANSYPSSATGACALTEYGNVTNVPGQLVITNPGNGQTVPAQAKIGIGANTGLLVEDNASSTSPDNGGPSNLLGAGSGTVGLPKPSSDITGTVVGAQYLGFIYTAGTGNQANWSSNLASFGFPAGTAPANCSSLVPSTVTNPIYGGDYANNLQANNGYGICDFAIDLGAPTANGLYTNATVYVGGGFPTNTSGTTACGSNCFSAVGIAGQLNGKSAIFVLGVDSTQPWAIYLLQSN